MNIKCKGIAHITLTVGNIKKTKKFYETLFETHFEMDDDISFSLLKVGAPCWFVEWNKHKKGDIFDETRIGLDHLAFEVKTIEELNIIINKLNQMKIKNSGLERFDGKYPYICYRDPDNIQTEFFIPEEL